MPKGKRENFRVQLMLDRSQRKALDRVIDDCNYTMHHAVGHAIQRLETLKYVTPLYEFEAIAQDFMAQSGYTFFDETKKEIARQACEVYANVTIGMDYSRRRKHFLICVVPPQEVIFSSSGRQVKVPYLGVVQYRRNMFAVSTEGGVFMPTPAHKMALGYVNNEASLVLMTGEPEKPQSQNYEGQKLVKVSKTDRRKPAPGTAPDSNPERK